ncbi:MAG: glycosyltransferase [Myxococcales bacterium]|nr:glycosyltransferase [Myxococcales bacterium]
MRRLRLGYVVSAFPVLSETFVEQQVRGLAARGHEVTVFGRATGQAEATLRLRHWPSTREALAQPVRALQSLIRCRSWALGRRALAAEAEAPFDAIVAHFGNNAVDAEALRRVGALEGPLVAVFHAWDLSRLPRERGPEYYRPLFAKAERLVAISEHGRRRLLALGAPPARLEVLHLGVDTTRFSEPEGRPTSREGPLRVLSVGRLVEKKGLADAIEAVHRLVERGVAIRYRIIGDGPLARALAARVAARRLTGVVELSGPQPPAAIARALDEADVFLLPSVTAAGGDEEGIPVSLMEAMAAGLPVVSTRHAGIGELVEDGVSGLLVEERDVAAALARLAQLAADPALRQRLGAEARRVVTERFELATQHAAFEALLLGLA